MGPDGQACWVANWEQWMQLAKCTNLTRKRAMQTVTWTDARVRLDIPHIPLKLGGAGLSAQWAKGVLWVEVGGAGLSTQVGSEPTVCQWEKAHNTGSGEHRATATEV